MSEKILKIVRDIYCEELTEYSEVTNALDELFKSDTPTIINMTKQDYEEIYNACVSRGILNPKTEQDDAEKLKQYFYSKKKEMEEQSNALRKELSEQIKEKSILLATQSDIGEDKAKILIDIKDLADKFAGISYINEPEREVNGMSCLAGLDYFEKEFKPPITVKTGFEKFDEKLGGGLKGSRLYVIGAISSLGKTTFALQIADNVAKSGHPVLFFSLEMSKMEIISKSLSRESFEYCQGKEDHKYAPSALKIYEKSKIDGLGVEILSEAKEKYREYAGNMYIKEGRGEEKNGEVKGFGVKEIKKVLESFVSVKKPNPMVVVDYLQILSPPDKYCSDKQSVDRNISELKRISRDFNIPVIAISSLNRDNYLNDVSFESFKESGAIEYSCDVLIGLQLKIDKKSWDKDTKIEEKRNAVNEAKGKFPRQIELVILKNRMHIAWSVIFFDYYPIHECFLYEGEKR